VSGVASALVVYLGLSRKFTVGLRPGAVRRGLGILPRPKPGQSFAALLQMAMAVCFRQMEMAVRYGSFDPGIASGSSHLLSRGLLLNWRAGGADP